MTPQATNLLHLVDLFSDLSVEQTNAIGDRCDWHRVEKGSEVIGQKQSSNDVYFVVEGRVAAKGFSLEGKEVTYAEIDRGEIFGEFSAIDGQSRSASIQALEDTYLARMTSADFRQLILQMPEVGLKLVELLVQKNRVVTNRMFEFSTMAVSQRICAELLRMLGPQPNGENSGIISPSPSHYEIATRLSTHREAVSKELANLSRQGIVKSSRRSIEVLDIKKLNGMTRFDFA